MRAAFPRVPDPLGRKLLSGTLTLDVEDAANDYIRAHRRDGRHDPRHRARLSANRNRQRELTNIQQSVEQGESVIVGVNKFTEREEQPIELLQIDATAERRQIEPARRGKTAAELERGRKRWQLCAARPRAPRIRCRTFWTPCARMPRSGKFARLSRMFSGLIPKPACYEDYVYLMRVCTALPVKAVAAYLSLRIREYGS